RNMPRYAIRYYLSVSMWCLPSMWQRFPFYKYDGFDGDIGSIRVLVGFFQNHKLTIFYIKDVLVLFASRQHKHCHRHNG
ncbi:MAG: hypothetical protein K5842_07870, partial [Bacteroidales bacterium]|nr:hypothetical protein [Bacteroidales bacterium]